jgi:hypothetical protein
VLYIWGVERHLVRRYPGNARSSFVIRIEITENSVRTAGTTKLRLVNAI